MSFVKVTVQLTEKRLWMHLVRLNSVIDGDTFMDSLSKNNSVIDGDSFGKSELITLIDLVSVRMQQACSPLWHKLGMFAFKCKMWLLKWIT